MARLSGDHVMRMAARGGMWASHCNNTSHNNNHNTRKYWSRQKCH